MCPSYLKAVTVVIRWLYALKSPSVIPLAYSSTILHHFQSYPLLYWEMFGWQPFRAAHSTSMSQQGHRGWQRFTSSTMIMVSRMCQCTKCMHDPVHVAALPWHPSTWNSCRTVPSVTDTQCV